LFSSADYTDFRRSCHCELGAALGRNQKFLLKKQDSARLQRSAAIQADYRLQATDNRLLTTEHTEATEKIINRKS
jgi:hypothetical protein